MLRHLGGQRRCVPSLWVETDRGWHLPMPQSGERQTDLQCQSLKKTLSDSFVSSLRRPERAAAAAPPAKRLRVSKTKTEKMVGKPRRCNIKSNKLAHVHDT